MNIAEAIAKPFIKSTFLSLVKMCDEDNIKYEILDNQPKSISKNVIGVMGISGNLNGSIFFIVPDDLALILISNMTGIEPEKLSKHHIEDGISEILNIICGNSKSLLADPKFGFELSIPTVIKGKEHNLDKYKDASVCNIAFEVMGQLMYLQICIIPRLVKQMQS